MQGVIYYTLRTRGQLASFTCRDSCPLPLSGTLSNQSDIYAPIWHCGLLVDTLYFLSKLETADILNYEELCGSNAVLIAPKNMQYIRKCICKPGFVGEGFHCEGIVTVFVIKGGCITQKGPSLEIKTGGKQGYSLQLP